MALTDYHYSVSGDFPNDKVNLDALTYQIEHSSISTALDHIRVTGDDCWIWFVDALSVDDQTTLDGLVAAHDGEPLPLPTEQMAEDVDEEQTSNTSWQDKVVLVTVPEPSGNYVVNWSAELMSSKNNNNVEVQVVMDGVGTLSEGAHDRRNWLSASGFGEVELTGIAERTIRLQFRKATDANQNMAAYIRRASLRISPVEE